METINFHKHLDECKQCKEQPFNLCSKGKELIKTLESPNEKGFNIISNVKFIKS